MAQGNTQTLRTTNTYAMAVTALMTAVTCILAPLSIPIGPVPISLTNFAIYLSLYLLDWKKGTISYILYLLLGLVGLPVFSGFTGGIGRAGGGGRRGGAAGWLRRGGTAASAAGQGCGEHGSAEQENGQLFHGNTPFHIFSRGYPGFGSQPFRDPM